MTTVGDFRLEGALEESQVEALLATGKYKSWVYLNPTTDPKCPIKQVTSSNPPVEWANPLLGPGSFNKAVGDEVMETLEKAAKPCVLQCSTATRASAALVVHLAQKERKNAAWALGVAGALNLKAKTAPQPIQDWIAMMLGEGDNLIFRQMFDTSGSSTYTYLLADQARKEAVLIDPVLEMVDRDLDVLEKLGLRLKFCINTHCHADHITGSGEIKKRMPHVQSVIAEASGARADVHVQAGDVIEFGSYALEVRATPGHTNGCLSFVSRDLGGMVFTGDALLIGGCGRTDFQQGNASLLYESVHSQIFTLPDHYKVYPGHDYKGCMSSTVGVEKRTNVRLSKSKEEFETIMKNLELPYPKKIDVAVPANLICGIDD